MPLLQALLDPSVYHGDRKRPPFFEGWYFKIVSADELHRFAFIPGVFLHRDPSHQHAFVQILNGSSGVTRFLRTPFENFSASGTTFDVRVGDSRFGPEGITLGMPAEGITGEIRFGPLAPWPVTLRSPGVMGWYAWVPFMECFHGVLSFDHRVDGQLTIEGRTIDLRNGRGYLEKDWGRSFPSSHIWMQTNHFGSEGTSLMASVAVIPWIRSSFPGFIVGLLHEGVLHRFATYTGAKIRRLEITGTQVEVVLTDRRKELSLVARRAEGGLLHAPTTDRMEHRLLESLTATVEVHLTDRGRGMRWSGLGRHAGLELGGEVEQLRALWRSTLPSR